MVRTNIFICQTPFQSFVCSQLCRTMFNENYSNIFISSVPNYNKYPGKVITIHNDLWSKISGLRKAKRILKANAEQHKENLEIFIPHVDGILANYVFSSHFFFRRKVKLNLFYEGVVMLDSGRLERNYPRYITRKRILALCIFHIFKVYQDILPLESEKISRVFTPHIEKTPGPKSKMVLIEFPKSTYSIVKNRCVVIGLDAWHDIERLYENLLNYIDRNKSINEVWFKPHYSDRLKVFQKMAEQRGFKYQLLQSSYCIEEIIAEYKPQLVVSPYLSSALINLKFMYGEGIDIICVTNESALAFSGTENLEFAKDSGIEMLISQSATSSAS
jgi:hypothetical protein